MVRGYVRSLFALGAAVMMFQSADASAAEKVVFAQDAAYPPYMMRDGRNISGIYADIIREADKRLADFEIELQAYPWQRALHYAQRGEAAGLVGTYYKPQERPWLSHFSKPLMVEEVGVFCRKGVAQPNWRYPNDFAGLRFGNNSGYQTPGAEFFKMVAAGRITLEEAKDTETNLRKVSAERVDCYVQDSLNAQAALSKLNLPNIEKVTPVSAETGHVGFSRAWVSSKRDEFIAAFDAVIVEMTEDGTIDGIVANYR